MGAEESEIFSELLGNKKMPMTVQARSTVLVTSLAALVVWREPVASWAVGIVRTLVEVDDWLWVVVALIAILTVLTTIGVTRWVVYVWLGVLGWAFPAARLGPPRISVFPCSQSNAWSQLCPTSRCEGICIIDVRKNAGISKNVRV